MAQEQFAGPEYFTEFDPEKFIRDMKIKKEQAAKGDTYFLDDDADTTTDTAE